jgi:hypothetical protein
MGEHGIDDARISDSDVDPGRRLIQCDELNCFPNGKSTVASDFTFFEIGHERPTRVMSQWGSAA